MRIDFPLKKYIPYDGNLPYYFEYPEYGKIIPDTDKYAEPYWLNIEFPEYKGKLHLSYKTVKGNLSKFIEDTRKLAYKHTIKADAIDEDIYKNDSSKVYGIIYSIKGNAASSMQFFLTDSNENFLRGALYFSSQPNKDSLAPTIAFFGKDVEHFIHSLKWKKAKTK
jgi:gliding motility-associated lipoprotein GldD